MMRRLLHDRRGGAAVEMAVVAPILAAVALGAAETWQAGVRRQNMAAALEVGAEYYLSGGVSDDAAVQAAREAWRDPPPDASVAASRAQKCGAADLAITSTACGDGSQPALYVTLTARGSSPSAVFPAPQTFERTIRVR
ncbi:pilus assembly protein [Brevundimonas sp. 2R-24]|uniref:Pilus assembly protein n=1 Tax=Peiella sedimenti TaxID=3061083 RepID=A0ABT8SJ22_9CAUL|nr:pilus assembly protein [Caulobacteraceae bacterium XZ-24]